MLKLVSEPAIDTKVQKMKQRVRWQEEPLVERGIDQTRFVLDDGRSDDSEFSFLVIGDSGTGTHRGYDPQRTVAELMLPHHADSRFMLHTGDVIYFVGSSEYYPQNFIQPYREFFVNSDHPDQIYFDQMVFSLPILPVLGNHDYYDLPLFSGMLSIATLPVRLLLRSKLDFDVGWHGSRQGDAYARAFLDYLKAHPYPTELGQHLDRHYTAKTSTGRCLQYQPGQFTRLPNRYYTFQYGGIDFFALDSNTFNEPSPLPNTRAGRLYRQQLEQRRDELEQEKLQIVTTSAQLNPSDLEQAEQLDDLHTRLSLIEEIKVDIDKQLTTKENVAVDREQLDWLKQRLICSWQDKAVRGRVLYFHHPPYVTENSKWYQGQTLATRWRLRQVFDEVMQEVGALCQGRSIVDLVLNGHAHCLEHLKTRDTGHADSHINWIICGGSGFSLRRQRQEGPELSENFGDLERSDERLVAQSQLYISRNGHGSAKRRPYSCLRIDVKAGDRPQYVVRPLVAEWYRRQWHYPEIEPFVIQP